MLGYLRTQGFIRTIEDIRSVQVDWETEVAQATTRDDVNGWDDKLKGRTVTTGCGQGTVFGSALDHLRGIRLPSVRVRQSRLLWLLENIRRHNEVYRQAGAVYGYALCRGTEVLRFVEDVGRHNAADAIVGYMWLDRTAGGDKLFYTTGRLTLEIVMKVVRMGILVLLSRSGVTQYGPGARPKAGGHRWSRRPRADISWSTMARTRSCSIISRHRRPPRLKRLSEKSVS